MRLRIDLLPVGIAVSLFSATILSAAVAASPTDCLHPAPIAFSKGTMSATRAGGIVRAESVCYLLSARAGQRLTLSLHSPDDNVVVAVYRPGYRTKPASDGPDISGATLTGAADMDEARSLDTKLPQSGRYLLVLGTTRGGGGEYRLRVQVR